MKPPLPALQDGVANDMENSEASAAAVRDVLRGRGEESSRSCETVARAEEELQPLDTANGNYAPSSALEENRASLAQAWRLGTPAGKKLLILNLSGILVACHKKLDRSIITLGMEHKVVGMNYVFKRPFCNAFIDFCFENFHVGVWSSRMEANVRKILDYIGEGLQQKLLFVMHQGDCTVTGFKNPTNRHQPLFLMELAKVWSRFPDGEFNETNTLLIDDTPYKALLNPPHTAIFLKPCTYNEQDNFLAERLVGYLTQLRNAADVREFVRMHPIGMPAIAAGCRHWNLYRRVLEEMKEVTDASTHGIASGNLEGRPHFSSTAEALVLEKTVRNLSLH